MHIHNLDTVLTRMLSNLRHEHLDLMTLICELDPYSLEMYVMFENELPTSRLSKIIVLRPQNAYI